MSFRRGRNLEPAPLIQLPDGSVVRGARRGGMTDHIAGPHLIPNVGREAMVPAECVRRAKPKPKAKPKPQTTAPKQPAPQATGGRKKKDRPDRPPRRRSRSRSRSRSARSASPHRAASRSPERRGRRSPSPDDAEDSPEQEAEEEAPEANPPAQQVREEEQKQLKVLEEARQKRLELEKQRRKNLGGAFAFTEDDIDADNDAAAQKKAQQARAGDKRPSMEKLSLAEIRAETVPLSSSSAPSQPRTAKEGVTALDLDGSLHDHKFSKTWKDWDASKANDPGEIARMFMKVSAVKRRGYGAAPGESRGGGGPRRGGSRSRSRR